MSNSIFFRSF